MHIRRVCMFYTSFSSISGYFQYYFGLTKQLLRAANAIATCGNRVVCYRQYTYRPILPTYLKNVKLSAHAQFCTRICELQNHFKPLYKTCVHACVCVCLYACVHACVRACMRACGVFKQYTLCITKCCLHLQISCLSSSSELRDRARFRYYYQLLLTDDNLAIGFFSIIARYNWRRVAIIEQDETVFTVVSLSCVVFLILFLR